MTTAQDGGKVVSLTHRPPLPPGNRPGTHFCQRLSRPQGHSATERIMSLKNSIDTIGNQTCDESLCASRIIYRRFVTTFGHIIMGEIVQEDRLFRSVGK